MNRKLKAALKRRSDRGFALPVAVGMGLIMLLVAATLIVRSQGGQVTASARKRTGESLAVAEGGIARTLAQLTQSNNAGLLTRNYDPINPGTGKTYLGPDGLLNTLDGETTAVNEWTSVSGASTCTSGLTPAPSISYSGTIGASGVYTLKAYRYNSTSKTGTFLVEGQQGTSASQVAVTVSIDSGPSDFPGILAKRAISLQGRSAVGSNGNVYYDRAFSANSSLNGSSAPGSSTRPQYLNAIHSGSSDSITGDRISGKIIACRLAPTWPRTPPAGATITDRMGDIALTDGGPGRTQNFPSANVTPSSTITYFETGKIDLHNNNKIDVNTTNGPVYIYVYDSLQLNGNSKIRNIRTDGVAPKVGDLRIILAIAGKAVQIYGSSCIDTAFLYVPGNPGSSLPTSSNIQKGGSGDGCTAHPGSTNIHGVLWAESISSTSGDYSGVSVPDDVSSLSDLTNSLGLPTSNKLGAVKSWQRQKL